MRPPPGSLDHNNSYLNFRFRLLDRAANIPITMNTNPTSAVTQGGARKLRNSERKGQPGDHYRKQSNISRSRNNNYNNNSVSTPSSYSSRPQQVTLLTLPRVELWCKDGVCYPYYKDYSRATFHQDHHGGAPTKLYKMPTVIATNMKNSEQLDPALLLHKSMEHSRRLNKSSGENNLITKSDIHKHRISVKNNTVQASSSSSNNNKNNTKIRIGGPPDPQTETANKSSRFSNNSDKVTLTIGNYQPVHSQCEDQQRFNFSTASLGSSTSSSDDQSASTTASSIDLDYPHSNNNNNHVNEKESGSNYTRNITRCSLGPVTTSVMTINNDVSVTSKAILDGQYNNQVVPAVSHSSVVPVNGVSSISGDVIAKVEGFPYNGVKPAPHCPSCNSGTTTPLTHHDFLPPELPNQGAKGESGGFWNGNHHHPHHHGSHTTLHREASFHSCGGFTLNGQPGHIKHKKSKMSRLCSSHKVAFVVSTFSLLVTIGLVITLLLMKKKGMMEAMR